MAVSADGFAIFGIPRGWDDVPGGWTNPPAPTSAHLAALQQAICERYAALGLDAPANLSSGTPMAAAALWHPPKGGAALFDRLADMTRAALGLLHDRRADGTPPRKAFLDPAGPVEPIWESGGARFGLVPMYLWHGDLAQNDAINFPAYLPGRGAPPSAWAGWLVRIKAALDLMRYVPAGGAASRYPDGISTFESSANLIRDFRRGEWTGYDPATGSSHTDPLDALAEAAAEVDGAFEGWTPRPGAHTDPSWHCSRVVRVRCDRGPHSQTPRRYMVPQMFREAAAVGGVRQRWPQSMVPHLYQRSLGNINYTISRYDPDSPTDDTYDETIVEQGRDSTLPHGPLDGDHVFAADAADVGWQTPRTPRYLPDGQTIKEVVMREGTEDYFYLDFGVDGAFKFRGTA